MNEESIKKIDRMIKEARHMTRMARKSVKRSQRLLRAQERAK